MTRLNTLNEKEVRLKAVEEGRSFLKKESTELIKTNVQLRKDLDMQESASKHEEAHLSELLASRDASLLDALADVTELLAEVILLKAEKPKIKSDAYTEGFRGYLKGFFAVDPGYDWSKFGENTSKWMELFKVLEAEAISLKKAQIAVEQENAKVACEARLESEDVPDQNPPSTTT